MNLQKIKLTAEERRSVKAKMDNALWSYGGVGAAISGGTSAAGTFITALVGGWDYSLRLLVLCMAIDFGLGILSAIKSQTMDSKVAFWGGVNKIIVLAFVAVGVLLDGVLPLSEPYCRTAIIFFYIGREGLSCAENYGKLGGAMPAFLTNILVQLKDRGDSGNDNNNGGNTNE